MSLEVNAFYRISLGKLLITGDMNSLNLSPLVSVIGTGRDASVIDGL